MRCCYPFAPYGPVGILNFKVLRVTWMRIPENIVGGPNLENPIALDSSGNHLGHIHIVPRLVSLAPERAMNDQLSPQPKPLTNGQGTERRRARKTQPHQPQVMGKPIGVYAHGDTPGNACESQQTSDVQIERDHFPSLPLIGFTWSGRAVVL